MLLSLALLYHSSDVMIFLQQITHCMLLSLHFYTALILPFNSDDIFVTNYSTADPLFLMINDILF